jgi:hypothetical protein
MKPLQLVGQRFGKLLVIEQLPNHNKNTVFKCICDCGNEKIIKGLWLTFGQNKSCGCSQYKVKTVPNRDHPLYHVWKGMKARCRDKKHASYKNYGARGVKVCLEWANDFLAFYNWAIANGWEKGLQIDKEIKSAQMKLPPLLYCPETCCFVSQKQNGRNNRNCKLDEQKVKEILQSPLTHKELAFKYSVSKSTIQKVKLKVSWQ